MADGLFQFSPGRQIERIIGIIAGQGFRQQGHPSRIQGCQALFELQQVRPVVLTVAKAQEAVGFLPTGGMIDAEAGGIITRHIGGQFISLNQVPAHFPLEPQVVNGCGAKHLQHPSEAVIGGIFGTQIPAGAVLDHGEVAGKPFLHLIQAVSE